MKSRKRYGEIRYGWQSAWNASIQVERIQAFPIGWSGSQLEGPVVCWTVVPLLSTNYGQSERQKYPTGDTSASICWESIASWGCLRCNDIRDPFLPDHWWSLQQHHFDGHPTHGTWCCHVWFEHLPTLARIVQKATWNKCDASHAIVAVALLGGSQKFHGVGSCVGRPRGCDDVAQAERLGERRPFILFVIRFALSRICPCAQGTQIRPLVWLIAYSTASWTCWFKSWHQRPIAWAAWVAPNSCLLRARWVKLVLQKVGRTMHGPLWCWKHLDYFQILQWIRTLRWARPLSFWIVSWLGRYAGRKPVCWAIRRNSWEFSTRGSE